MNNLSLTLWSAEKILPPFPQRTIDYSLSLPAPNVKEQNNKILGSMWFEGKTYELKGLISILNKTITLPLVNYELYSYPVQQLQLTLSSPKEKKGYVIFANKRKNIIDIEGEYVGTMEKVPQSIAQESFMTGEQQDPYRLSSLVDSLHNMSKRDKEQVIVTLDLDY